MQVRWAQTKLAEVLRPALDPHAVDASRSYANLGIYSFGRGVFAKPPIEGANTSATTLYRVRCGQFIYSRLFAFEGAYATVPPELDGAYVSNEFPTFDCDPNRVDPRFLHWLFKRPSVWREIAARSTGMGDRRQRIHPEQVVEHEIPLPPLDDQRRIIAHVEALAVKVEEARGLREHSVAEGRALMSAALNVFERRWEGSYTTLGKGVLSYKNGLSRRPSGEEDGPIVLRLADVSEGVVDLRTPRRGALSAPELEAYSLTSADLLVVRVNGSRHIVGRMIEVPSVRGALCFNDHLIRIRLDPLVFNPRFVATMARGGTARRYIEAAAITTAGQLTINQTMLADTPMPAPPLDKQHHIVAELDALQEKVNAVRALQAETAAELDAMMPAILDKAFKGEL